MGSTKGKPVRGAPQVVIHTYIHRCKYNASTKQQANKKNTRTNTLQIIPNYNKRKSDKHKN